MPDWACKQKIRGWVEVVFTVMPNGHVANVKLVDANPRGVFEAAAIERISHWIYDSGDREREVKQRVETNPHDCVYKWKRTEKRRVGQTCVRTGRSRGTQTK